jgi:hypothetical protein
MRKDPIVEEVRKHRKAWAAKFGYDIDAMAADLKRREAASRKRGVKFVLPRKPQTSSLG